MQAQPDLECSFGLLDLIDSILTHDLDCSSNHASRSPTHVSSAAPASPTRQPVARVHSGHHSSTVTQSLSNSLSVVPALSVSNNLPSSPSPSASPASTTSPLSACLLPSIPSSTTWSRSESPLSPAMYAQSIPLDVDETELSSAVSHTPRHSTTELPFDLSDPPVPIERLRSGDLSSLSSVVPTAPQSQRLESTHRALLTMKMTIPNISDFSSTRSAVRTGQKKYRSLPVPLSVPVGGVVDVGSFFSLFCDHISLGSLLSRLLTPIQRSGHHQVVLPLAAVLTAAHRARVPSGMTHPQ